ncbi:hypothetical protein D3C76_1786690 [compost metagenome]
MEAHQHRVVGPITTAQQVPAVVLAYFTVKCPQAAQGAIAVAFAIGAVHGVAQGILLAFGDDAVVCIGL